MSTIGRVNKVDVVRRNPRTTETVGDDGTIDPDFLRKPRRPEGHINRVPFVSFSDIDEVTWSRIFGGSSEVRTSDSEGA